MATSSGSLTASANVPSASAKVGRAEQPRQVELHRHVAAVAHFAFGRRRRAHADQHRLVADGYADAFAAGADLRLAAQAHLQQVLQQQLVLLGEVAAGDALLVLAQQLVDGGARRIVGAKARGEAMRDRGRQAVGVGEVAVLGDVAQQLGPFVGIAELGQCRFGQQTERRQLALEAVAAAETGHQLAHAFVVLAGFDDVPGGAPRRTEPEARLHFDLLEVGAAVAAGRVRGLDGLQQVLQQGSALLPLAARQQQVGGLEAAAHRGVGGTLAVARVRQAQRVQRQRWLGQVGLVVEQDQAAQRPQPFVLLQLQRGAQRPAFGHQFGRRPQRLLQRVVELLLDAELGAGEELACFAGECCLGEIAAALQLARAQHGQGGQRQQEGDERQRVVATDSGAGCRHRCETARHSSGECAPPVAPGAPAGPAPSPGPWLRRGGAMGTSPGSRHGAFDPRVRSPARRSPLGDHRLAITAR